MQKLQRKRRVTFDLQPLIKKKQEVLLAKNSDNISQAMTSDNMDLIVENDQLRKIIAEMEKSIVSSNAYSNINNNNSSPTNNDKTIVYRKATTHARIKEIAAAISNTHSANLKEVLLKIFAKLDKTVFKKNLSFKKVGFLILTLNLKF